MLRHWRGGGRHAEDSDELLPAVHRQSAGNSRLGQQGHKSTKGFVAASQIIDETVWTFHNKAINIMFLRKIWCITLLHGSGGARLKQSDLSILFWIRNVWPNVFQFSWTLANKLTDKSAKFDESLLCVTLLQTCRCSSPMTYFMNILLRQLEKAPARLQSEWGGAVRIISQSINQFYLYSTFHT